MYYIIHIKYTINKLLVKRKFCIIKKKYIYILYRFHRILYLYIDMTLSLIFQFIANDKMYNKNSKINGVSNTSVLRKIGKQLYPKNVI